MGRIVNQVFSGITAALGQPLGLSHGVFDGLRSLGLEPRDFTSRFHEALANVPGFPKQTAFVIFFHTRFLLVFVALLLPRRGNEPLFSFSSASWNLSILPHPQSPLNPPRESNNGLYTWK